MVRKEICASNGVKLVFHIEGATVKAHWIYDPDNPHWVEYVEKHAQPGEFAANDFIELGQTLVSIEQGEAHDAAANLDMGKLAENMIDSMNKLAIMGNLTGGKNEA